jgi:hypothetical protein
MASVLLEEPSNAARVLQDRYVQTEIEPVDALELELDMVIEDLRNAAWYRHGGLRSSEASKPTVRRRRTYQ